MEVKLTIRLTESDHNRLKEFAQKKGMSIAAVIRHLVDKLK